MPLMMGTSKDRHGTYYARKKVPPHLQEAVARVLGQGKTRQTWLKRSLATKDHSEANRRVKAIQIEFDRTLERAQELLKARPIRDNLSDAEIKLMADYHYAWRLHDDDEDTREGTGRDAGLRTIADQLDAAGIEYQMPILPSEHAPAFGLSESEVLKRQADLDFVMPIAKAASARGDVSKVGEFLDYLLNGVFGINLDPRSEAYRRLGLAVLRKEVAALEAIQHRMQGRPIETPTLPVVGNTAAASGDTLRAAFEGWKRHGEPAQATLNEYERAIKLFVDLHGDLPVAQMRKSHVRQFREALQNVPRHRSGKLLTAPLGELAEWGRAHPAVPKTAASTVNKNLGGVQAVANWARDNGMIPDDVLWADPFARMRLPEGEVIRGGSPFELSELQVICQHPVNTAAALFRRLDRRWRSSGSSLFRDSLLEALDAIIGEGWNAILANAINAQATVFGKHVDLEFPQPFVIFAEHFGNVVDGENVGDCRQG